MIPHRKYLGRWWNIKLGTRIFLKHEFLKHHPIAIGLHEWVSVFY